MNNRNPTIDIVIAHDAIMQSYSVNESRNLFIISPVNDFMLLIFVEPKPAALTFHAWAVGRIVIFVPLYVITTTGGTFELLMYLV